MPQWFRDRSANFARYPDERWVAFCPGPDAPLLLRYDHHTVWIRGRRALLRTYKGATARAVGPFAFEVSFTYARGHPAAPSEVQAVVDRLTFCPADDDAPAV